MRVRVLSDLHLEFQDWNPPDAQADIIVLAGDPMLTIEIDPLSPLQRAPGWIEPPLTENDDRIRSARAA